MPISVQLISATWCKRCDAIKPEVAEYCEHAGTKLVILDYDEMDVEDTKDIKSLPTIRLKVNDKAEWVSYTAATLEEWKAAIMQVVVNQTTLEF